MNACCFLQVTDLTLAKENQTSFEEYLASNSNADPGIDLTVTVLTTGFWPSYKSFDLNLPAEMVRLDLVDINNRVKLSTLILIQFTVYMFCLVCVLGKMR